MSDLDFLEDDAILIELSDKVDKLEENLKIGLGCNKPDPPEVCSKMKGGKRKRKSRKKRGKGAMMSRRKKMSAREPKKKYIDDALEQLIKNPEWIRAGVVDQVKMMRDLAFKLEDADKQKGGRKKRKSRRKTKKRRKSRRRKSRRRRR